MSIQLELSEDEARKLHLILLGTSYGFLLARRDHYFQFVNRIAKRLDQKLSP
ncbi:hypothetical protein J2755_000664 [Methanohalophilus levihalophilus]|uniref:hypothetical protein n=1 Tax=Methanohalophilus levihalophilus TaxID=1431282 RepID=UPI001AE68842|nr:hypothetical protein [Methanohalophilus levihalophilus]MBP2029744.1 hypothetical protein [Methanohalophilus levihalophilus]